MSYIQGLNQLEGNLRHLVGSGNHFFFPVVENAVQVGCEYSQYPTYELEDEDGNREVMYDTTDPRVPVFTLRPIRGRCSEFEIACERVLSGPAEFYSNGVAGLSRTQAEAILALL